MLDDHVIQPLTTSNEVLRTFLTLIFSLTYSPGIIRYNTPVTHPATLSDIHGNLPAVQAVLDDASRQPVDGFIQAGDYTCGPHAPDCLRLQRSLPD